MLSFVVLETSYNRKRVASNCLAIPVRSSYEHVQHLRIHDIWARMPQRWESRVKEPRTYVRKNLLDWVCTAIISRPCMPDSNPLTPANPQGTNRTDPTKMKSAENQELAVRSQLNPSLGCCLEQGRFRWSYRSTHALVSSSRGFH